MATYGYVRVSTEEQARSGMSLAAQTAIILNYANLKGLELPIKWISEEGVSASIPFRKRPRAQKLLERIRAGDNLVISKLDRAWRSVTDCVEIVEELEARKVNLHLLDLNIDTSSPVGRMFLAVAAAFAQFERDRLRERTKEGLKEAKKRGKTLGNPPFGSYEKEKPVLDFILELAEARVSSEAIARTLDPSTSRSGRPWTARTVRRILRRHGY